MRNVFLSYRRADSSSMTRRLYDWLTKNLGGEHVFRDVDSIPLGVDFGRVLWEEVARCDIVVVVVGPNWLAASGPGGRRLDDPEDFVRIEIELALSRGVPIFIALSDAASMPPSDCLPHSLRALADCPGFPIRSDSLFHADAARLLGAIRAMPPAKHRDLTNKERWAGAFDTAFRRAWLGPALGLAPAGVLAGVHHLWKGGQTAFASDEAGILLLLLLGWTGGAFLGWRHLGLLGLLAGSLAGPVASVALYTGLAVVTGIVGLLVLIPIYAAGWMGDNPSNEVAFICGQLGALTALPAGLYVARNLSRRRARREKVRFPVWKCVGGGIVGEVVGALGAALILRLVVGYPMKVDSEVGEKVILILYAAALCGLVAVADGIFAAWREQKNEQRYLAI